MKHDAATLSEDEIELLEKSTLRTVVQALQEYSREARELFETTPAMSETEVIVLAEDLLQYSLEVAECYPINRRYAGFIDYKRIRWFPASFGLVPQVLLVDAKASTESNRETLQQSQLPLDAEFASKGKTVHLKAGIDPFLPIKSGESTFSAIATSIFVHFHYTDLNATKPPFRRLHSIFALSLPHARLKDRYNPSSDKTFFGQGKHSPKRNEDPRIRVYFARLREMCNWRLQQLDFKSGSDYSVPLWRDVAPSGKQTSTAFPFIGR